MARSKAPIETDRVGSSSVHPFETSDLPLVPTTRAQSKVHAKWIGHRSRVINALRESYEPKLQRRAERIDSCCAYPQLARRKDGSPHLVMMPCRDRMCPRCAAGRSAACKLKVGELVKTFDCCRFFTLTLDHRKESLSAMLVRLAAAFRLLRKEPAWRSLVKGGVYGIEATFNVDTRRWHAHLHILADGDFFPQPLLKKLWKKVTGGAEIVYIEAVNNRGDAAKYVSKYVCKPEQGQTWPLERLAEFAEAMHGKRLLHTFGSGHGRKVEADEEEAKTADLEPVGSLAAVVKHAKSGDHEAAIACETLQRMGPRFADAAGLERTASTLERPPIEQWEVERLYAAIRAAVAWLQPPEIEEPPEPLSEPPKTAQVESLLIPDALSPPTLPTYR